MLKSIGTGYGVLLTFLALSILSPLAAQGVKFDSDTISGLGARNIGSATMSGRISALKAVKEEGRLTVYIGSASGGVWKSVNGGTTYKPMFDKQPVQSIGAIAIDPQAPKTIWVGTGESWTRNSVSIGDGIYRSTDGGETWTNMGLTDSERISKILPPLRAEALFINRATAEPPGTNLTQKRRRAFPRSRGDASPLRLPPPTRMLSMASSNPRAVPCSVRAMAERPGRNATAAT